MMDLNIKSTELLSVSPYNFFHPLVVEGYRGVYAWKPDLATRILPKRNDSDKDVVRRFTLRDITIQLIWQ